MRWPPLALLSFAAAAACAANEPHPKSPVAGVQRVLAVDFAPSVLARRSASLQRLPGHAAEELGRAGELADAPVMLADETKRIGHVPDVAKSIAKDELRRRPDPMTVLPHPNDVARDISDDLGKTPVYLGLDKRPLGEIDDREHRTDPADDRPEKTMWQRLRRRLLPGW